MKSKILFIICIVLAVVISASAVCAADNNATEISQDDEATLTDGEYDKIVDHRQDMELYKTTRTPFEVEDNETFVKNIGLTCIEIRNSDLERSYHEMTYTYKNGQKVIADEWSCPLNLGATNVNRDGLIVCHVLLHGNEVVKEKEPVYKTVKVNKKVVSHYKKVKKASYVKSDNWCNKNVVKDLKRRINDWDDECCPKWVSNIVNKINYNDYDYKIKILKKYPNKMYRINGGYVKGGYKIKIILYKKKPVYKTVQVKQKEFA